MNRPILLDLFCGAGGASMGYHRAGFDVVGVDIKPQPRYPFPFILGNAIDILRRMLQGEKFLASDGRWYGIEDFDAIHASPPCQKYTKAGKQWRGNGKEYPDLIDTTRRLLIETIKPYVIENVPGAPLINPVVLNGGIFSMLVHRVRLFECSFDIPMVLMNQLASPVKMGRKISNGDVIQPVGNFSNVTYARKQMEIDWMTRSELAQAIPPAYTEFIGKHLFSVVLSEQGDHT